MLASHPTCHPCVGPLNPPPPPLPPPSFAPWGSKATAGVAQMAACSLSAPRCLATSSVSTAQSRSRSAPGMPPCAGQGVMERGRCEGHNVGWVAGNRSGGAGFAKGGHHNLPTVGSAYRAYVCSLPPPPDTHASDGPAPALCPTNHTSPCYRPPPQAHRQCDQVEVLPRTLLDALVRHQANLAGAGDGEVLLNRCNSHLWSRADKVVVWSSYQVWAAGGQPIQYSTLPGTSACH